jgi:hypothetical protein
MSKQTDLINIPDAITVSGSNVGIGTSSPAENLHISSSSGSARIRMTSADGSDNMIVFGDASDSATGAIKFDHSNNALSFNGYNNTERMRIDSSGKVGIGTTSPDTELNIGFSGADDTNTIRVEGSNGASERYAFDIEADGENAKTNFKIGVGGGSTTTCMTLDSSGHVLVGTTDDQPPTNNNASGIALRTDGKIAASRSNGISGDFNTGGNGDLIWFRSVGNVVGKIEVASDGFGMGSTATGIYFNDGDDAIIPAGSSGSFISSRDNAIDLGRTNARFDDIYATNGTIQTSDFNEKQDIASLTATEMLVGKRISTLFKTFRWKDSVAEKGDNARTHTGVIAQDVQAAFTAEGLDAGDYALFISSTWWEHDVDVPAVEAVEAVEAVTETTTDENGNEVVTVITEAVEAVEAKDAYTRTDTYDTEAEAPEGATSKTRMGIRYPELLSFVAAYNEQRFASIEARLTALEA